MFVQRIDKSTPHSENENHEALLVSNLVELKQNNVILKQRKEKKDVKIQKLENKITHLKEQNVGLTKTSNEVHKTQQALKKQVKILSIHV